MGGNGAGKGAAGAVGVGILDALAVKPGGFSVGIQQVICVADAVTAFAQDCAPTFLADDAGSLLHLLRGVDFDSRKQLCFGNVWGDDRRHRQKNAFEQADCFGTGKDRTAGRNNDRIDDDILRMIKMQSLRNGVHQLGGRNHPDFDGIGTDVLKDGVNLLGKKLRSDLHDGSNAGRVLRGECGDCRGGIYTVHRHGFDVSLNTGACAGITSGDG